MRPRYRVLPIVALLALVVALLPGCQRASYSFQPVPAAPAAPVALPGADVAPELTALSRPPEAAGKDLFRLKRILWHRKPVVAAAQRRVGVVRAARPATARGQRRPTAQTHYQPAKHLQKNAAQPGPGRHRSKAVALLLAVFLGPFGAHRFYLGYYAQGAAYLGLTAAAAFFFLLSLISLLAATASVSGFFTVTLLLTIAIEIWLGSDIVRIIANDLLPKDGDYER
ncbi:TM2 domain-containing protein [Hymenobacter properus]|uniref:TM2 domain-containing protein n=1 Tax=Hymenobacter properus TaxID=2791026 RepID=A0A931FMT2_9BACT|nr:TM2 domain-containing protein [Hymenobacter properus]MBF9141974.1 TM2 domain-containing protein [Hymenobacter properus]MBR7720781.1 TM2 domain-containing protein [Microvirga sp. SRT04]